MADLRVRVLWERLCLWWLDVNLVGLGCDTQVYSFALVWWAYRRMPIDKIYPDHAKHSSNLLCNTMTSNEGLSIPIVFTVSEHTCLPCEMLCCMVMTCDLSLIRRNTLFMASLPGFPLQHKLRLRAVHLLFACHCMMSSSQLVGVVPA